jgi:hypothetical protein
VKQLLGADDAQRFAQFVADRVLPAVAPREREIGGLDVAAAREPGDDLRVFVVRVRADDQHAGIHSNPPQRRA